MFARKSFFRLKSISVSSDFRWTYDNEVLPLMRSQTGFLGALTLANPGSLERIVVTLWESKADQEFYDSNIYPQVLKILAKTIDGRPKVHTFEAVNFAPHNGKTEPEIALAAVE
jgi:hypothetical protein